MRVGLSVALLAIAILSTTLRAEATQVAADTVAVPLAIDTGNQVAAAKPTKAKS